MTCLQRMLDRVFVEISRTQTDSLALKLRRHERHASLFENWNECFQIFLEQCHTETNKAHCRRLCLLELQYLTAKVFHAALLFEDEMLYDEHTGRFERIITLCRSVVELEAISSASLVPQMAFSFDLVIIMPLYFTATKCRHPSLRRDALHLLKYCPRREGIWLSWVTGWVVEQIISIEENGLYRPETCNDIPMDNRIQLLEMYYNPCTLSSPDQSGLFNPLLSIKWRSCSSSQTVGGGRILQKTIELPATTDSGPGQRPYCVVMPLGQEYSHWKLLLGKKTFSCPG